ncbi:MAG: 50S ribosomal protein L3 [Caldilineaceae bacterium]|nr:50S ribosomal protein L3 [Caldilineaceae bacterium]MCB0090320.1 50S ribosomal protein L3 [Caldilineaceae bacterium]MCB0144299.1 50S ribosomal protein L3 [Caldilineaceae bacterium]MCB9147626.1 50S ribosomal protein L3 [Caldilineaceae bacterium]MCB9157321.1 50S ribosomal protein L3 [Caldilineaceae bacterium]
MRGILGKKVGMTQLFDESGAVVPVTVIEAGPCYVTQVKTDETDGYCAVQIGYEEVPERKLTKGERGHLSKAQTPNIRRLRELRFEEAPQYTLGDEIKADVFQEGDFVDVVGVSKGKGFAGAVKRHNFRGGPKTHGQSDRHRATGSRGAGTTPGHTFPGSKAPGQMGNARVTIQNLKVALVDAERNLLVVRGAIPGPKGGLVFVREAVKKPKS